MNKTLEQIADAPFCPTIVPTSCDVVCAFIEALSAEGYPALEVLSRPLDAALELLAELNRRPQRRALLVGLGTIVTEEAARAAVKLSPDFLVSPAFSRSVLRVAAAEKIPYMPAVLTLQDVQNVLDGFAEHGLSASVLKLCPCYGLDEIYVQMLAGCYPGITYCPTGMIDEGNLAHWKRMPHIGAPMGSRLVPPAMMETRDVSLMRKQLRRLRELVLDPSDQASEVPGGS